MIENTGICERIEEVLSMSDLISFGLNDMTSSLTGIDRNSWSYIYHYYNAKNIITDDPFERIQSNKQNSIIYKAINKLAEINPDFPILICGNLAPSINLSFLSSNNTEIVIEPFRKINLSLKEGISIQESIHNRILEKVKSARIIGDLDLARSIALNWIKKFHRNRVNNWKLIKKEIVGKCFGFLEGKYFKEGWKNKDIIGEINLIISSGNIPRCSEFRNDISCHSKSIAFDSKKTGQALYSIIELFSKSSVIHIFPQQSSSDTCFRLILNDDQFFIEIGIGQAINVFENNDISTTSFKAFGSHQLKNITYSGKDQYLKQKLDLFINIHLEKLIVKSKQLSFDLGLTSIGIEGYFNEKSDAKVKIVDIDIPLDIAWN
jgi:hypothetical protein